MAKLSICYFLNGNRTCLFQPDTEVGAAGLLLSNVCSATFLGNYYENYKNGEIVNMLFSKWESHLSLPARHRGRRCRVSAIKRMQCYFFGKLLRKLQKWRNCQYVIF